MNKTFLIFLFALSLIVTAPAKTVPVQYFDLDPDVVLPLPVAFGKGTTTIMFPAAIEAIRARNISADPKSSSTSQFYISYTPGNHYFTLAALQENASDVLTVIYSGVAYNFELTASKEPVITANCRITGSQGGTVSTNQRAVVAPARLASLLDIAKAWPLLSKAQSPALQGVTTAAPNRVTKLEGYTVYLQQVWRFDKEDTLVFWVRGQNLTAQPIYYDKSTPLVRLQNLLFTPSITDATGELPPGVRKSDPTGAVTITPGPLVDIFFAITGTPDGGRSELLADNAWNVILPRLDYTPPKETVSATSIRNLPYPLPSK